MLVKVGDVWVDPLNVVSLEWHEAIEPVVVPAQTYPAWKSESDSTAQPASSATITFAGLSAWYPDEARPAYVEIAVRDGQAEAYSLDAHGVTLDEAAHIINRAREAHMGRR